MALPKVGVQLVLEGADQFFGELKRAQDAVKELGQAVPSGGGGFDALGRGAAEAARNVDRVGQAAQDAGGGFDALREVGIGALRQVGAAAVTAGAELARGIAAGVADSVAVAGDFEAAVNNLAAVSGDALAQAGFSFDDVSAKALQLGQDTRFSASESIAAMTELVKGGVPVAAVMDEATNATLNLAAAAGVDLANAAEIVAKQYGVWADTGLNATQISDLLTQAANASTVGVEDLALGLANVGGVAKVTGLGFGELTQTMALIAPGFSSAADAGTSLKTFLTSLQPATKPAEEAMAGLGLYSAEMGSAFFDASGEFVGMEQAAALLQGSLAGLSAEQQQAALKAIFGQDAFRAAALIAEAGAPGFNAMGEAMGAAGTAAETAAIQNQGFNFAMDSLKGSLETLQIIIGSAFLPILTDVATALGDGIGQVSLFVQALQGSEEAAAGLSGPMAGLLSLVQQARDLFAPVADAIGQAAGALMEFGPGSVSATAALMNLQTELGALGGKLVSWIQEALPGWTAGLAELGKKLGSWVMENLPGMLSALNDARTALVSWVIESLPGWGAELLKLGTKLSEWVVAALPDLGTNLGKVAALLITKTGEFIADVGPKLIELGTKFVMWVATEALPKLPGELAKIASALIKGIGNFLTEIGPPLLEVATAFLNWIATDVLPDLPGKLAEIGGAIVKGIGDFAGNVIGEASTLGADLIAGFVKGVQDAAGSLYNAVAGVIKNALGSGQDEAETGSPSRLFARELGVPISQGIALGIGEASPYVQEALGVTIGEGLSVAEGQAPAIGAAVGAGMADGISKSLSVVQKAAGKLAEAATTGAKAKLDISSPSQVFADEVGKPVVAGFAQGITDNLGVLLDAAGEMSWAVLEEAKVFAKTVQDAVGPLLANAYKGAADYARGKIGALDAIRELNVEIEQIDTKHLERLGKEAEKANLAMLEGRQSGARGQELAALEAQQRHAMDAYQAADAEVKRQRDEQRRIVAEQRTIQQEAMARIREAQAEANKLADPAERAAMLSQATAAITEEAKVRQQLAAETDADERAYLQEKLKYIREAQAAEFALYSEESKARERARQDALRDAEDAMKQLGNLLKFSHIDLHGVGNDAIAGITRGMLDGLAGLRSTLGDQMAGVLDALKRQLGIASPSKLWAEELGKPLAGGVGAGFTAAMRGVTAQVQSQLGGLTASVAASTVRPAASAAQMAGSSLTTMTTNQYNYQPVYQGAPRQPSQDFAVMRSLSRG